MNYELATISMQTLNYIFLLFSMICLYWCSVIAYDRSVKIIPFGELPIFNKQSCIIKHIEMQHEDNSLHDLSIYYSGIKKFEVPTESSVINIEKTKDKVIQEEILKIVQNKQKVVNQEPPKNPVKKVEIITEKPMKKKQAPKAVDDDTFSAKSPKKTKKSSSIFDVIE
jgi:hypothetical protein